MSNQFLSHRNLMGIANGAMLIAGAGDRNMLKYVGCFEWMYSGMLFSLSLWDPPYKLEFMCHWFMLHEYTVCAVLQSPSIVLGYDKHCIESVFSEVIGTHVKTIFSKSEVVYICIVLLAVLFSLKSAPLLPFPWVAWKIDNNPVSLVLWLLLILISSNFLDIAIPDSKGF